MNNHIAGSSENYPDTHHDVYSKTVFGFWVYLMTDFMMFATFFAVYAVLINSTYGGPSGRELFSLQYTLIQSILLLAASFTSGIAGVFVHKKNKRWTIWSFIVTFLLGVGFLQMEYRELSSFVVSGNGWDRSAYLSAFFTLIGMHALHVIVALLWIIVLLYPVFREGITPVSIKRLTLLRMFWQFINVVWVFIFGVVYLNGSTL